MPRDLLAERDGNRNDEALLHTSPKPQSSDESPMTESFTKAAASGTSASPEQTTPSPENAGQGDKPTAFRPNEVKPYVQSLTILDVESCVKLESATFPPQERCSREKFIYRFSKCGELSMGLFTSADVAQKSTLTETPNAATAATASTAQPVYSGTPNRKSVLVAHVIATKSTADTVTDAAMALPDDWQHATTRDPNLGHNEAGRTLCLHSLAVLPDFQRKGLGTLLLRSYIQRVEAACLADRIALIAHDHLVPFYEAMGFENKGHSKAQFGGGGWIDMVLQLKNQLH